MNQATLSFEQPILGIGQIASDLIHPQPICLDRDISKLDAAGRKLDKEQNEKAPEPSASPNSTLKKSAATLQPEGPSRVRSLPTGFPNSFRRRLNAIAVRNVGNRGAGQATSKIRNAPLIRR
jgi:hypothetical protein